MGAINYLRIGFVAVIVCACAPQSPDNRQPMDYPSQALDDAADNALQAEAFSAVEWIDDTWWQLFEDSQLTSLIEKALSDNPQIEIADAKIWIANAQAKGEYASLFPTIDAGANSTRVKLSKTLLPVLPAPLPPSIVPLNFTLTTLGLEFCYEIDWWGKHRNAVAAAVGKVHARVIESAAARILVALSVAESYFQYQTYAKLSEIAERQKSNHETLLSLSEQRLKRNLENELSVEKRRRALSQAVDQSIAAEQQVQSARLRVSALIAGNFEEEIVPINPVISVPYPIPENLPANLLTHRPDIAAQRWSMYAHAREIDVAKALFYPNINLFALLGFQTVKIRELFQDGSRTDALGGSIYLPIFHGGALNANLEAKNYAYAAARAEYENLVINAVEQVLDAIMTLQKLNERYIEAKERSESSERSYEITKERLRKNIASQFDLLAAEGEWLQARSAEVQLQGQIHLALLALIRALGGGFGPC